MTTPTRAPRGPADPTGSGTRRHRDQVIGPVAAPDGRWILRHRYGVLASVVTAATAIQTRNGQWSSDMWQHVAVVRELIAHPLDPTQPQVVATVAHPDFSPYTVVLGLIGHVSGLDAVAVLSVAAIVNVVLLLIALRRFVVAMTDNERAPFYALVFVLLLWGLSPYRFSGFFGLNSIGFVAPYPSTIATAIALFVLVAAARSCRGGGIGSAVGVALGAALVVLIHPLTAAWLIPALGAVAIGRARSLRSVLPLVGAGVLALVLSLAWPYFSIVDLVLDPGSSYDALNDSMYSDVLLRLLPPLLGLVVVVQRVRVDRRDVLAWLLLAPVVVYIGGLLTDRLTYGRTLAFVVLILDVALADGVGRVEARWREVDRRLLVAGSVGLAGLLLVGTITSSGGIVRMVPTALLPASVRDAEELARPDETYAFLVGAVGAADVVAGSTERDDLIIPALAGRTVRVGAHAPFLDDIDARADDAGELVDPATSAARRAELVQRYDVRFVLVHPDTPAGADLLVALEAEGATVVRRHDDLALVRLG